MRRATTTILVAAACLLLCSIAGAQTQIKAKPASKGKKKGAAPAQTVPAAAAPTPVPPPTPDKGTDIEEVVARVNNDIITRSDLDRASQQLRDEILQGCKETCTTAEANQKFDDAQKDLLRDLIDNSLMVQRAKDSSINVDAQVVKRLDEIRIENHIPSLEELEKRVNESGQDYEDFKNGIKSQLLQQEVIRKEVGARILIDHAEVLKYYEEHKPEFVRPETVVLSEMFVSTQGKTEAEAADLRKKADGLLQRVKDGEDFGELAKRFSDGSTAKQGGDLGDFERSQLAANLADVVFKLKRGEFTSVLPVSRPQPGYLILTVREHYAAGQQPEEKVDAEISSRLYSEKIKPALRTYLSTLRQDSYLFVKPGYLDSAAVSSSGIEETAPSPDAADKKADRKAGKSKTRGA